MELLHDLEIAPVVVIPFRDPLERSQSYIKFILSFGDQFRQVV